MLLEAGRAASIPDGAGRYALGHVPVCAWKWGTGVFRSFWFTSPKLWLLIGGLLAAGVSYACGGSSSEPVEPETPALDSITIEVETVGPGSSFTTPHEALVRLAAEVTPPESASEIWWTVVDDPADYVQTPVPLGEIEGAQTWFLVPRPNATRWASVPCPGALNLKSLALEITARAATAVDTVASETEDVRQDEIDTVRQEYVDLGRRRFPERDRFDPRSSPHFKPSELNPTGDYNVYWAEQRMLDGLEALRAIMADRFQQAGLPFYGLILTSVFRNPVHHTYHAGLTTTESPHQYGLAADMRIWGHGMTREEYFYEVRDAAHDDGVGACFEPEELIRAGSSDGQTLTHAHVDWRDPCPTGW